MTDETKESRVTLIFREGMRDVSVEFGVDKGTMSPRKIEFAGKLLLKAYRKRAGELQTAEHKKELARLAVEQKAAEAIEAEAQKKRDVQAAKDAEQAEKSEFARLQKKFGTK
jgi:hypothetical protein